MKISILVPAHNEAGVLRECLDAVLRQTLPVDEIVVVADTCTDNTVEVAREYGAVLDLANEALAVSRPPAIAKELHLAQARVLMEQGRFAMGRCAAPAECALLCR